MSYDIWKAQVLGDPNGESWEISVVRTDNIHGQESWGWFDERKLLISHNGGPCRWPLAPGLGPLLVQVAEAYAAKLNGVGPVDAKEIAMYAHHRNEILDDITWKEER